MGHVPPSSGAPPGLVLSLSFVDSDFDAVVVVPALPLKRMFVLPLGQTEIWLLQ